MPDDGEAAHWLSSYRGDEVSKHEHHFERYESTLLLELKLGQGAVCRGLFLHTSPSGLSDQDAPRKELIFIHSNELLSIIYNCFRFSI